MEKPSFPPRRRAASTKPGSTPPSPPETPFTPPGGGGENESFRQREFQDNSPPPPHTPTPTPTRRVASPAVEPHDYSSNPDGAPDYIAAVAEAAGSDCQPGKFGLCLLRDTPHIHDRAHQANVREFLRLLCNVLGTRTLMDQYGIEVLDHVAAYVQSAWRVREEWVHTIRSWGAFINWKARETAREWRADAAEMEDDPLG